MVFRLGRAFLYSWINIWSYSCYNTRTPDLRIEHAWANDYDDATCKTYRHNICKDDASMSVYCGDVRKLDISLENPLFKDHPFNAFAFGFPCNDFSVVGEQKVLMELLGLYIPME